MINRMPTVVEVMAEYGSFLWDRSPDWNERGGSAVEPADLGVSPALVECLDRWNGEWERRALGLGVSTDGLAGSGAWQREGLRLARQLQREFDALGHDIAVLYAHGPDERNSGSA